MTFQMVDPVTNQLVPCGGRTVTCATPGCTNQGVPIEVADDGSAVICGPCGQVIVAAEPTVIPPAV